MRSLTAILLLLALSASTRSSDRPAQPGADPGSSAPGFRRNARENGSVPCASDNAGLVLPEGFCALLVGEKLGGVRHLVVAPNGDVFASVEGWNGGVLALRDADGDGRAEVKKYFGPRGGTGIALGRGYLYFATANRVVRWRWAEGQLEPSDNPETVVLGLPENGDHTSKSLALGSDGAVYVNIGSATNSCQRWNRVRRSPGIDPCEELNTRAGVWRFSGDRLNQRQEDGVRFGTGLRNSVALAVQPGSGRLFAVVHGRDQLGENWGYSEQRNADLPAEELVAISAGDDFGWPYCYYDQQLGKLVLAPEYGGDGTAVGRCADRKNPLIGFPGHWGPLAIAFYGGTQFPPSYREGAFIAFHGSWNRAPLPQAGFRVVFVPFAGGLPTGQYSTFATGARAPNDLHASGVAVGPDGSLYIAAQDNGAIWRIMAKR